MKNFIFLLPYFIAVSSYCQHQPASYFHQNAEHTGVYSSALYGGFGNLLLKIKTGGKIFGSPAVYDGFVYVGSEDKNLYAINIADKKLHWKFPTGGAVFSSPAVFNNIIYFASYDGYFYAVNAVSGTLAWKFKTLGEKKVGAKGLWTMKPFSEYMDDPFDFFLSSPVIDEKNQIVYFGSGDGNVYALNAKNGQTIWSCKTNGIIHTSPALSNGTIYIGSWDKYFYAIDSKNGKIKWKFRTKEDTAMHLLEGIQSSATVADGIVYFGSRDGHFYALNAQSGQLIWKYDASNSWILTTAAFSKNTIYIGTSDTYKIVALDAKTGEEISSVRANGYVYSSPAIAGETLYIGDFTGQFLAIDLSSNGKILDRYETEGRKMNAKSVLNNDLIDFAYLVPGMDLSFYSATVAGMNKLYTVGPVLSSPAIADGNIFFGSADGYLYGLTLKKK